MAVSHRGAISFGMVYIPVGLYTATQDNDIHFNQLCKEDGSRVKYKKICASCGKEVGTGDIVKGFEFEPGKYVTMTDADFEKAKSAKDKTIHILHFTDLPNIRPIYFDKTYHVVPEQGGDKAFELLRRAMKDENKIAVAKTVMANGMTSIVLGQYADKTLKYRGHVTLGVGGENFRRIRELPRIDAPDFAVPSGNEECIWVEPSLCCTVKYMEKTESGSLRQPVFKGLRVDKLPEECIEKNRPAE